MSTPDPKTYWEDRLAKNFNLHGVGYIGLGMAWNEWTYRVRATIFARLIRKLGIDPKSSRILDIGSGTGFYIEQWRDLGANDLTGSDIADNAVVQLREAFPGVRFEQLDASADQVPFESAAYDVVTAMDILFHITDSERHARAIKNCFDFLRPGGYFIFSDFFLHETENRGPQQESRSLADYERAVRAQGFQIVKRVPMFARMNNPVDSTSPRLQKNWVKLRDRVKKGGEEAGERLGRKLYRREVFLTGILREGPSTEIMVCRKPS